MGDGEKKVTTPSAATAAPSPFENVQTTGLLSFKKLPPGAYDAVCYPFNSAFWLATKDVPVAAVWLEIKLRWKDGVGGPIYAFDIYPNDMSRSVSYVTEEVGVTQTNTAGAAVEEAGAAYPLVYQLNRALTLDRFNFFRQLSVRRVARQGGNTVTLQLLDPTGFIIEDQVINAFLTQMSKKDVAVSLKLSYGWCPSPDKYEAPPEKYRVGTEMSYLLVGLDAQVNYWGTEYTLTFVDSASAMLSMMPSFADMVPPDTGVDLASGVGNTPPYYVGQYWNNMVAYGCNTTTAGATGIGATHLMAASTNSANLLCSLKLSDYKTKGSTKDWDVVSAGECPIVDVTGASGGFLGWLTNLFSTKLDKKGNRYLYGVIPAGGYLPGGKADWVSVSDKDSSASSALREVVGNNELKFCIVEPGHTVVVITKDTVGEVVNGTSGVDANGAPQLSPNGISQDTVTSLNSSTLILKKYRWLSPGTDKNAQHVENTVLTPSISSSGLMGLYFTRKMPLAILPNEQPNTETAKEPLTEKSYFATLAKECSKHSSQAASLTGPGGIMKGSTEKDQTKAGADALKYIEATSSFTGLSMSLDVIGDPDLPKVLYHAVQLEIDPSGNAMLPWIQGTYMVIELSDSFAEGAWTSQMGMIKLGGLQAQDLKDTASKTTRTSGQVGGGNIDGYSMPLNGAKASVPAVNPDGSLRVVDAYPVMGGSTGIPYFDPAAVARLGTEAFQNSGVFGGLIPEDLLSAFANSALQLNVGFGQDGLPSGVGLNLGPFSISANTGGLSAGYGGVTPSMASFASSSSAGSTPDSQADPANAEANLSSGIRAFYDIYNDPEVSSISDADVRFYATSLGSKFGKYPLVKTLRVVGPSASKENLVDQFKQELGKVEYTHIGPRDLRIRGVDRFVSLLDKNTSST